MYDDDKLGYEDFSLGHKKIQNYYSGHNKIYKNNNNEIFDSNEELPCQLCSHVVMVGLKCFSDLWDYAVEPLIMLAGPKVRFQTKRDAVRFRDALLIRRDCLFKKG